MHDRSQSRSQPDEEFSPNRSQPAAASRAAPHTSPGVSVVSRQPDEEAPCVAVPDSSSEEREEIDFNAMD